jgi:hypothetical protein
MRWVVCVFFFKPSCSLRKQIKLNSHDHLHKCGWFVLERDRLINSIGIAIFRLYRFVRSLSSDIYHDFNFVSGSKNNGEYMESILGKGRHKWFVG